MSLDLDLSRGYLYTADGSGLQLHRDAPIDVESQALSPIDRIPVVRQWDGKAVTPDNLLLYAGSTCMLMNDKDRYDAILNLDIERGVITSRLPVVRGFTSGLRGQETIDGVEFKVNRFDYDAQGSEAQYERCAVGINSNHVMRFDLRSGDPVQYKAYERANFTAVVTDVRGNVIVGDADGSIRLFTDVGKRAARVETPGPWKQPMTHLAVNDVGDVLATTDQYILLYSKFVSGGDGFYHIGRVDRRILDHLGLAQEPNVKAQWGPHGEVVFGRGRYLFHWARADLEAGAQRLTVYEAPGGRSIDDHKFGGQFALAGTPLKFALD